MVPELIRLAPAVEKRGFAALVIGCYSDPGLDALREMLTIPVIGPGAASLHLAAQLGTRISVLTPSGRGFGRVAARLRSLALADLLASVRGIGLSVMDLAKQKPGALDKAADAARIAIEQDGADVLVLGCMSMAFLTGICEALSQRVGVPVVNPVVAAEDRGGRGNHADLTQQGGLAASEAAGDHLSFGSGALPTSTRTKSQVEGDDDVDVENERPARAPLRLRGGVGVTTRTWLGTSPHP